ncbi:hypothetical protein V8C26DRAFT_389636 [Trichoderma gracile]
MDAGDGLARPLAHGFCRPSGRERRDTWRRVCDGRPGQSDGGHCGLRRPSPATGLEEQWSNHGGWNGEGCKRMMAAGLQAVGVGGRGEASLPESN